jgi:hypothetical protein
MKKAIAMKCSQKDWDSIKGRIPEDKVIMIEDFKTAIKETALFTAKAKFSQNIILKHRIPALYDYYLQAKKYGISYLRQNPNILSSEVSLIDEILNKYICLE